jgi:hypothetical protein
MSDHALGARLRQALILDRQRGLPLEGRRLQGLAGDLCGADQQTLLPPLRHLVLSPAFLSGACHDPPFAEARLRFRLINELRTVFAAPLCDRMEAVIDGLLDLPAAPGRRPTATTAGTAATATASSSEAFGGPPEPPPPAVALRPARPDPAASPPPAAKTPAPIRPQPLPPQPAPSARPWILALLGFLSGTLLLSGAGLLLWRLDNRLPFGPGNRQPQAATALPPVESLPREPLENPAASLPRGPAEAGIDTPAAPDLPPSTATPPAGDTASPAAETPTDGQAGSGAAIRTVEGLYAALSRQDFATARSFFSGAAADQFDPAFFRQFSRVSVEELRPTGQGGSGMTLEGVVRFTYRDGSEQTEARSFQVEPSPEGPRISASAFQAVLSPRSPSKGP